MNGEKLKAMWIILFASLCVAAVIVMLFFVKGAAGTDKNGWPAAVSASDDFDGIAASSYSEEYDNDWLDGWY